MEFTLKDLMRRFMRYSWIIILVMIIFGSAGFFYAKSAKTSTNFSTSRLVLIAKNNTDVKDPSSRVSADKSLIATYKKLATDDSVLSLAQEKLPFKMSKSQIADSISIDNPTDTLMLSFKASEANTNKAKTLANAYAEAFAEEAPKLYPDMGQPTLLSKATGSDGTTSGMKNKKKLTLFGAVIGFVVSSFGILIFGIQSNYLKLKKQG
ncbi:capsular biosynthesis protein [Fructobacillus sp. M158]|uniref:YveK family protein n=1 Tax=Fructobacillus parabroussonetiae TaxID=2713174 RepID=UPI00200AAC9C|nr:Wzz/FepE/Etk N-terminal domain-containing protein [Fructobacillus parabroussonetiae]MCK8616834.1 capsular biosynthesis protein [Fructobacillus parabroussonetiae]